MEPRFYVEPLSIQNHRTANEIWKMDEFTIHTDKYRYTCCTTALFIYFQHARFYFSAFNLKSISSFITLESGWHPGIRKKLPYHSFEKASTMLLNHLGKKINSFRNSADLPNLPYGSGKSLLHGLLEIDIFEAKNLPDMEGKNKSI